MDKEDEIDRQLLVRYTEGTYSRREFRLLMNWFSDRRMHGKLRAAMENHWNQMEAGSSNERSLDHLYRQLTERLEQ